MENFIFLVFTCVLVEAHAVIEIHSHDHSHLNSPLPGLDFHIYEDQYEVPSSGDGALNPWLYRFPPWYDHHNPQPPSLHLTNGEAAKNTRNKDHLQDLNSRKNELRQNRDFSIRVKSVSGSDDGGRKQFQQSNKNHQENFDLLPSYYEKKEPFEKQKFTSGSRLEKYARGLIPSKLMFPISSETKSTKGSRKRYHPRSKPKKKRNSWYFKETLPSPRGLNPLTNSFKNLDQESLHRRPSSIQDIILGHQVSSTRNRPSYVKTNPRRRRKRRPQSYRSAKRIPKKYGRKKWVWI